jgi:hypothetical protein
MKKYIFLYLLFATPLWGQNTIALEYSSEVPFVMASKNSIEVFEKQLFASKLANDIIGALLNKVEQDPTPFYDTLQLIYNDTSDWVLRYL